MSHSERRVGARLLYLSIKFLVVVRMGTQCTSPVRFRPPVQYRLCHQYSLCYQYSLLHQNSAFKVARLYVNHARM